MWKIDPFWTPPLFKDFQTPVVPLCCLTCTSAWPGRHSAAPVCQHRYTREKTHSEAGGVEDTDTHTVPLPAAGTLRGTTSPLCYCRHLILDTRTVLICILNWCDPPHLLIQLKVRRILGSGSSLSPKIVRFLPFDITTLITKQKQEQIFCKMLSFFVFPQKYWTIYELNIMKSKYITLLKLLSV